MKNYVFTSFLAYFNAITNVMYFPFAPIKKLTPNIGVDSPQNFPKTCNPNPDPFRCSKHLFDTPMCFARVENGRKVLKMMCLHPF